MDLDVAQSRGHHLCDFGREELAQPFVLYVATRKPRYILKDETQGSKGTRPLVVGRRLRTSFHKMKIKVGRDPKLAFVTPPSLIPARGRSMCAD